MRKAVLIGALVLFLNASAEAGRSFTTEDGQRYYVETEHKCTWSEAIDKCREMNIDMELIAMDSQKKTQDLNNLIKANFDNAFRWFWTGGHDHHVCRHFEWISTGEAFGYTNWYSSQPDNSSHHCVLMYTGTSLKWNDYDCNSKFGFACEGKPLPKAMHDELLFLRASVESQRNLLKVKTEELDSLKNDFEKFKTEPRQIHIRLDGK